MTKNILIAYYTKSGASEEYAKVIAETLKSQGLSVEMFNLADNIPDITYYDTVVLGTGVRMFIVYRRWKKLLKQKELKNKHLFMFLSSGMAIEESDKAVEKFLQPLIEKYNLNPNSIIAFPGKTPEKWAKYDENLKETMKPDLAKRWAEDIAGQLQE